MRHVPHLFLPGDWPDGEVSLDEGHVHHLSRVLRRSPGSDVTYTNGLGLMGSGEFTGQSIVRGDERMVDRRRAVHAVIAPPAERDRQRFTVEKLAELGVAELTWLVSLNGKGRPPRSERAQAWAQAALEQSRGAWQLEIETAAVALGDLEGPVLVCDAGGSAAIPSGPSVTYVVGPEGGWAEGEIPDDHERFGLGERVLRVETAAVAAAVLLLRAE